MSQLTKEFYSTRELAELLSVDTKMLRRLVRVGRLAVHRVGCRGLWRFSRDDVAKYLAAARRLDEPRGLWRFNRKDVESYIAGARAAKGVL